MTIGKDVAEPNVPQNRQLAIYCCCRLQVFNIFYQIQEDDLHHLQVS